MREVIGVLRGGPSSEFDVSLKSGAVVLSELNRDTYEPIDLFIDRSGQWHRNGFPVTPEKALRQVDVAFNALHGKFGEDGKVQRLLDTLGVPYTGSDAYSSALAFHKVRTKDALGELGIKLPRGIVIEHHPDSPLYEKHMLQVFRSFPMPAMVKPVADGSSVGMMLATDFNSLASGAENILRSGSDAFIEEYIRGREATVGVVDGFRGEKTYALLPIEIVPPETSPFFDYDAKYSGKSLEICPGNFKHEEKEHLMDAAKRVHEALGLSHYSRSDFIVSKRGIYFLEVNTLPGLTKESLLPKALHAVGAKLSDFFDHVISLARRR